MKNLGRCFLLAVVMAAGLAVTSEAFADVGAVGGAGIAMPANPHRLYLRPGEVDTSVPLGDLHAQIGVHPAGTRFVIQLDGPITPERRAQLVDAGIEVGPYLPKFAYIVTLDNANPAAVARLDFIRWHSVYQNAWKLDPDLGVRPYNTPERQALAAEGRDYIVIVLFPGADPRGVEDQVEAIPGAAIVSAAERGDADIGGASVTLYAQMNIADVARLAEIADVQYVEPAPDATIRAARRTDNVRWIVQSNTMGVTPLYAQGLRGEGQIVGILDTRVRVDHCSFDDPGTPVGPNHRKLVAINNPGSGQSHGTHVAGIVVGDAGSYTGNTRGVAYMGRIVTNGWGSSPYADIIPRLQQHHDQGARIHSNSWGDDGTTAYNALARDIDQFQWDNEESLTTWAVTNTSALKNPENAKNTLAVGATRNYPDQEQHGYGGTGPTSDGRRKPEIYAPGRNSIAASSSSTCGTTSLGGTSMACPAISGVAMLTRQYFMEGYFPVGLPVPGAEFTPSAALVKAMLLNSTVDMTGVPGFPSNQEGWGRVLADNTLYFEGDDRKLRIQEVWNADGLTTGQVVDYPLPVVGSGEPLRVTLAWIEPPGTAGTSFAAVNDLDLEVIDPAGQMYRGNVFDTSAGHSITGGSKDDRNNVEQVHITNPTPGLWTVRVRAAAVNQAKQGYAVVTTGDITPAEPPALILVLGQPVPFMVEPNQSNEVRVRILEGSQALVPGSGMLHFRDDASGQFGQAPLTHVSGDIYAADLPPTSCGKTLEFYFSALADDNSTVTLPEGAPDYLFSTNVAVMVTEAVMDQAFPAAWPTGWEATGLWHVSVGCAPPGTPCAPGPFAYYGRSTTCNYNLPTGRNSGELYAPPINLPVVPPAPAGNVTLRFCYALETEEHMSFDRAELYINGQTRPEWRIDDVRPTPSEPDRYWTTAEFDLTEFAGQTINLAWHFDTVTGTNNNFRGWHIANVEVLAAVAGCEDSCYADCDGNELLNVDDFMCFINAFSQGDPYADCDGNGIFNVDDFMCFINEFSIGCP